MQLTLCCRIVGRRWPTASSNVCGKQFSSAYPTFFARRQVSDEHTGTLDFIKDYNSFMRAFTEAKAIHFDVADEFTRHVFAQADGALKNSDDTATRYFTANSWLLPAPRDVGTGSDVHRTS